MTVLAAVYGTPGAIQAGKAVIAVHPRGQIETDRAIEILNDGGPSQI